MTNATETAILDDLTSPDLLRPSYIEGGRRKWEARSPGALIAMFAAGGFDVITPDRAAEAHRRSRERLVKDQQGHVVAYIIWHLSVPDFAVAYTARV